MPQKNQPSPDEETSLLDSRHIGKKPYQKPEFRSERVFETKALARGKVASSSSAGVGAGVPGLLASHGA